MTSIGEANTEIISELNSSLARVKFGKVNVMPSRESTAVFEQDDHHGNDELQDQETTIVDESEPTMRSVYMFSLQHECLALSYVSATQINTLLACAYVQCASVHTYSFIHYIFHSSACHTTNINMLSNNPGMNINFA